MKKSLSTKSFSLTVIMRPDAFRVRVERPPKKKIKFSDDFWVLVTVSGITAPIVGLFALMIMKG